MKLRSSLIIPILAASIIIPTAGAAAANSNSNTNSSNASTHQEKHKGAHQNGDKGLTNIINQYASPQLKDQLTKDLATQKDLEKQLHQTSGFKKKAEQDKAQRKSFYEAHKQEIDSIQQQLKDGKLTKQQAHEQLRALFGQQSKDQNKEKFNQNGARSIHQELKAAVQKKDQAAINSALEKLDQQIQSSNKQLQQQIEANK